VFFIMHWTILGGIMSIRGKEHHSQSRSGLTPRWRTDFAYATATSSIVKRTLSEARAGQRFEPPKNGKGRSIRLTGQAVEALRDHLELQLEEIDRLGDLYSDRGLVFPSQVGTPMTAKNASTRP
jgi:hypothetical protein